MIYKIYLPNETQEKLLYAGEISIEEGKIEMAVKRFMQDKDQGDLIISDQGEEGLSVWKGDEIYCLLKNE